MKALRDRHGELAVVVVRILPSVDRADCELVVVAHANLDELAGREAGSEYPKDFMHSPQQVTVQGVRVRRAINRPARYDLIHTVRVIWATQTSSYSVLRTLTAPTSTHLQSPQ